MKFTRFAIITAVVCVVWGCVDTVDTSAPAADTGLDAGPGDAVATDTTTASECLADRVARVCDASGCADVECRVDEWCHNAQCVLWHEAEFTADFELTVDTANQSIEVIVTEGGFPREFVEALRFDFGDGVAGWAEKVDHAYVEPGVYPVELDVRFADNHSISTTRLARVNPPQDFNPLHLTVNQIPGYMNGSAPVRLDQGTSDPSDDVDVPIHLRVVRDRFVIDIGLFDDAADPIDRATLELTADVGFGTVAANESLMDRVTFGPDGIHGELAATDELAPPVGMVTLTLSASTEGGASHSRTLQVEAADLTPATDPFDRPHVWLFRTDRDYFATTRNRLGGTRYEFASTAGADGEPDFEQELRLMGALGDDDAANARYLDMIKRAITLQVYRYFGIAADGTALDDIAFEIVWQGDPGAPDPATFDPQGEFSMMRFGGFFDGYIGFSVFSEYNELRVDDSTVDYGVASAAILGTFTSFAQISDAFAPIHPEEGTRVGEHPLDSVILAADFDRYGTDDTEAIARYDDLVRVARYIALGLAPVIAHEMGHAMGLMPDGLPPEGYFGGRPDVSFVGADRTNRHHADLPGINLMQAGGDNIALVGSLSRYAEIPAGSGLVRLAEILSLETRLSPLSRAYMQRRLTH